MLSANFIPEDDSRYDNYVSHGGTAEDLLLQQNKLSDRVQVIQKMFSSQICAYVL